MVHRKYLQILMNGLKMDVTGIQCWKIGGEKKINPGK